MLKFKVTVRKYLDVEVPVKAPDGEKARDLIFELISKGDTKFMFDGVDPSFWENEIRFIGRATDQEFNNLAKESEIVHPDGTHSWAE